MFHVDHDCSFARNLEQDLSFEMNSSFTNLAVQDAIYKGEGNANIVIALPHERRVIRFRKSLPGEVSPDGGKTRAQREVRYVRNVVSCFLATYTQIPEIVRYDAADIAKLSDVIRPRRPEKRRCKVITDTYATKFPDFTFLDLRLEVDQTVFRSRSTFCVEVKPKQGYLPKQEQRFPGCPYCLNQYAKLRRGDIVARNNYCPFEFFSGVEARMKAAVKELLKSPQNNLRIFKDGIVVYNQDSSPNDLEDVLNEWFRNAATTTKMTNVDEFCNLTYAALTRPFAQQQLKESSAACYSCNLVLSANQDPTFCADPDVVARAERYLRLAGKICNFDGDELPRNSVLERIRNMQRLSYVNTNYIYGIYSDFASLLNDDMIYSDDLMELRNETRAGTISHALPSKFTNAAIQKEEDVKDVKEFNTETLLESIVSREYVDNSNGNHNASSECILSTNVKRIVVNGDFASQTERSANLDSRRLFHGSASLHNQRTNDEQETNMQIIAKHLSTLRMYLLFATARDCSILMTFRELYSENLSKVPVENTIRLSEQLYFLSSVKVSDLDPKSVHSIVKHRQRDLDVFDSVISLSKDIFSKNTDNCQRSDISNNVV